MLPGQPNYRLRAPDASETPFPEVPARFTQSTPNWVDLRPGMDLRVENAYYREGSAKHDLAHFLGTEVARFEVRNRGDLHLVPAGSLLQERPPGQMRARQLIRGSQRGFRHHRFFYEILLKRKDQLRGAVLLSAATGNEIDQLAERLLAEPASVCGVHSLHCAIFPETCIVSLEMEIEVNGAARTLLWGNSLGNVVAHPRDLQLLRRFQGRLRPVFLDPADPNALRLPLLPGDQVTWD